MVIVFVAKDTDELKKYRAALEKDATRFSWPFTGTDRDIEVFQCNTAETTDKRDEEAEWSDEQWDEATENDLEQSHIEELRREKIEYYYKEVNNGDKVDHVFLLSRIPEKDEAKNADFPDGHVVAYMDIFAGLVSCHLKKKVEDKDICVFIHWGIVSPDAYEKKFRDKVRITKHKDIKTFAVSSNRSKCFDVRGGRISLPGTHQEIQDMLLRFTYEVVKDVFSEYVWNETIEMSGDVVSQVDYYLHDWLLPRLQDYGLKDDIWKMAAIRSWDEAKEKHSSGGEGSCVIARDEKLLALFSHLIATGGVA